MSKRFQRTLTGVGLALGLSLLATPAVRAAQAAPARHTARVRHASPAGSATNPLTALWSALVGGNPHGPNVTQGPTVDPNGVH